MRVHPFIATPALLLAGVMAFGATVVVQHRRARARRPPPVLELEEPPLPPRQAPPVVAAPRPRRPPPAPAPAPTTELHVHVAGPHGLALDGANVSIHRRGAREDDWHLLDPDERSGGDEEVGPPQGFSDTGLEPGRYDVRVEAPGMRTLRLDDLAPGPKVIEVGLARAPVLLGVIGALGASGCAGVKVTWTGPGQEAESGEASVNEDECTFVAESLPDEGPVTVVAARGNRREMALVTAPLSGDPAVLCLAPPCAAQPASLLVYVADTDRHEVEAATLTWTLQADELHGEMGTSMGAGQFFLHDRRIGQTLALHVERGTHAVDSTVTVGAGITEVVLTLPVEPPEPADDEVPSPVSVGEHAGRLR